MARAVRLVVAVVAAAVVGYVTDNPQLALATFSAVYGVSGIFAPGQKVFGSKLADLKAPQASYGSVIPYIEGTPRLAAIVVWNSDKRTITHTESSGKGGSGVTSETYTYEIDILYEIAINRCSALRRVWSNGKLVWTAGDDANAGSIVASSQTDTWRAIRFYDGNPDQLPDPVYEAAIGIGRAPAYRSRTAIMVEGLNLQSNGQIPVLTFEVVGSTGEDSFQEGAVWDPLVSGAGINPGPASFNPTGYTLHVPQWDAGYGTAQVKVYDATASPPVQLTSYNVITASLASTFLLTGNSDVSCLVISDRGVSLSDVSIYADDGSRTVFNVVGSSYLTRVARLGDDVIFGSNFGGNTQIFRCSLAAGGAPLASSAALGSGAESIAITTDGFVWVGATNGSLFKLDLATLTLQLTTTMPETAYLVAEGETLYARGSLRYSRLDSGAWDTLFTPLPTHIRLFGGTFNHAVVQGVLYNQFSTAGSNTFTTYALVLSVDSRTAPLDQVVRRLCLRTKQLGDADIDVTQLAGDDVRAMFTSQVAPTRSTLEMLGAAFFFECVEGEVVKFVKRGAAAVVTIPFDDLGTSDEGDAEPTGVKRLNNIELPSIITVKFANMADDFQDGAESGDRLTTESTTPSVVEFALGLLPSEAKRIAEANTMDAATSILQIGPIAVPMKYAALEDTDPINVVDRAGNTYRARIVKTSDDAASLTLDLVVDDATVINSAAATDDSYSSSNLVRITPATVVQLLDIPILRDDDDGLGFYAVARAGDGWRGGELDRAIDGTSFQRVASFSTKGTIGTATTALGGFADGNVVDALNVVRVDVGDATLSSIAYGDLLASTQNAMLIGTEILQFGTASFVSAGVYDLSLLRRGLRGTEFAIGSHVVGERVVLLEILPLRRVDDVATDLNRPTTYKAPTFGTSLANARPITFTNTGVALKPFAPVDLHADYGASPLMLSWHRRSRRASQFLAPGLSTPLGEASEAYQIDIRNGSALVATLTSPTSSVTIPSWAAGNTATVYQMSEAVGRGYGASITL